MDQFGLQFLQPRIGSLTLREIANEAGKESCSASSHIAYGQFHGKGRLIFALSNNHTANPYNSPIPGPHVAVEIAIVFVTVRLRHQQFDVLSYYFVATVSTQ